MACFDHTLCHANVRVAFLQTSQAPGLELATLFNSAVLNVTEATQVRAPSPSVTDLQLITTGTVQLELYRTLAITGAGSTATIST